MKKRKRHRRHINETTNIVHLITQDEIEHIILQHERRYSLIYSGQQLRDRIAACVELKQELLEHLTK